MGGRKTSDMGVAMKKNLTTSGLLFEAARLVERAYAQGAEPLACCDAINYVAVRNEVPDYVYLCAANYFAAMFKPKSAKVFWFGELNSSNVQRRILALYFAAHAAKSEGL